MESETEERREVSEPPLPLVPSITEAAAAEAPPLPLTKRKITSELIQDYGTRRSVYRKRREGLLKKMKEITTLCGIDACIIIYGPGDDVPMMWPSAEVTKQLLIRYRGLPEMDRFRNVVTQWSYMQEKTRKMEAELKRINERNNEREMLIFIHEIYKEGKPLSAFHVRDLERLLAYVQGKMKNAQKRIGHVVQPSLPASSSLPLVPVSCSSLPNMVVEEQVPEQQPTLNLVNIGVAQMNNVFDSSNMNLQPRTYVGNVDTVLPQGNFSGFNSTSDSGILPPGYFGGLINGDNDYLRMLSQSNFVGFNAESHHSGLEVLPQATFGGFNVDNDHLLSQGNFGGFSEVSVPSGLEALPQGNFGDLNGLSDHLNVLPQGNFGHFNEESVPTGLEPLPQANFGDLNVLSDDLSVLPQGNFGSFNAESDYFGLGVLPQGNFGDNSGSLPQGNFFGLDDQRDHSWMLPELSFGGQNVESDLGMSLPPGNFIGFNGESCSGNLHGSFTGTEIGNNDLWNSYGHFGSTISESDMRLGNNISEGNIDRGF
ncbi:agamous-like MADS-box protein AGL80 [Gastrolobium bilobum]|uniref:agamous-like MADS-box protein AGL80 n=1 Tax=Gastrolobium bilobum TaxID=150636 RepID=UPI002AB29B41|nr:agamous-like MADS-box protein AGL80 [Gastrolobium bilobum]